MNPRSKKAHELKIRPDWRGKHTSIKVSFPGACRQVLVEIQRVIDNWRGHQDAKGICRVQTKPGQLVVFTDVRNRHNDEQARKKQIGRLINFLREKIESMLDFEKETPVPYLNELSTNRKPAAGKQHRRRRPARSTLSPSAATG